MKIVDIITELSQNERKKRVGVENDQFFTRPEVAKQFADWVKSLPFYATVTKTIEPAAGNLDLARHFPNVQAYDLDPQHASITKQDFLTSRHGAQPTTLVVMNPPFGKRSDLAIQFFNKAATFADYIAQIVPRTFRRDSTQSQLAKNFHLVAEYVLPRGSFYLPGESGSAKYDVPAVAQVWRKAETQRQPVVAPAMTGVKVVPTAAQANVAFRRKGRRAGEIFTAGFAAANPNSFIFMRASPDVIHKLQSVDWSQYGNDVMGARSIAQSEIAAALQS
jgi:predicted RNA methylase